MNSKGKLLLISSAFAIIIAAVVFLRTDSLNSVNVPTTSEASQQLEYENQEYGIKLYYPKSYVEFTEYVNLPEGNLMNIYLDNESHDYTVEVSLYQNDERIGIPQFILKQKQQNNILLPELILDEGFEPFLVTDRVVNGISYTIYTSKQTGERTYFSMDDDKMVMIREEGQAESENLALDEVASSFEFLK